MVFNRISGLLPSITFFGGNKLIHDYYDGCFSDRFPTHPHKKYLPEYQKLYISVHKELRLLQIIIYFLLYILSFGYIQIHTIQPDFCMNNYFTSVYSLKIRSKEENKQLFNEGYNILN